MRSLRLSRPGTRHGSRPFPAAGLCRESWRGGGTVRSRRRCQAGRGDARVPGCAAGYDQTGARRRCSGPEARRAGAVRRGARRSHSRAGAAAGVSPRSRAGDQNCPSRCTSCQRAGGFPVAEQGSGSGSAAVGGGCHTGAARGEASGGNFATRSSQEGHPAERDPRPMPCAISLRDGGRLVTRSSG